MFINQISGVKLAKRTSHQVVAGMCQIAAGGIKDKGIDGINATSGILLARPTGPLQPAK